MTRVTTTDNGVVDVVGDPAEHLASSSGVEVGQRQPVHFVFDLQAKILQGPPHRHVEQPGLRINHQRGNQIHAKSQRQRTGHRAEVDAVAGYHMHPGEQVGEGVVAMSPRRGDGLILGDPRRQSPADDAVE
jgi:hypothetical protein